MNIMKYIYLSFITLCVLWILGSFLIASTSVDIGKEAAYAQYLISDQENWKFEHTLSKGIVDTQKDGLIDSLSSLIQYDRERRAIGKSIVWIILGISIIGYIHSVKRKHRTNGSRVPATKCRVP